MDWTKAYKKVMRLIFAQRKADSVETSIGLDIGSKTIVCLEVLANKNCLHLKQFAAVDTPETPKDVVEAIRNIFSSQNFSTRKVRIGIGGPAVIVRYINLPYMTGKELSSSIMYESEKYIPFKSDDVYLDYYSLGETPAIGGKRRVNILLVAAKKEKVKELVKLGQDAGLEVEVVDSSAVALLNSFLWSHPETSQERICQVDFGARYTTVNIIDEGTPVFTRDVSFGGEDVISALTKQLDVGVAEAQRILNDFDWEKPQWKEAIAKPFAHLTSEVRLSVNYFEHQLNEGKSLQKVFIHGGISKIPGFQVFLERELGHPVQYANPLSKLEIESTVDKNSVNQFAQQSMVALGLALHGREV